MATGEIRYIATIDTSNYKRGANEIDDTNDGIDRSSSRTSDRANKSFSTVAKVGLAAIATAAVAVGAVIVSNIGGAITRIDTLNNSARVFKNLGFDADSVSEAMSRLQESIQGLPTPLDAAVRGTQNLAATYGDIRLGQRVFSALNNAILSVGGSSAEVENAIQQLSQVPLNGPLDAQTWNSLRNSGLTPVLVTLSKEFGRSIDQLKEDFGSGELTVQDFTDALLKLDEEGGSGVASLQTQVRDATGGIGTSFANLNTAIQRNIGNIISAFGVSDIAGTIQKISTAIDNLGKFIGNIVKTYIVPFTQELQKVFGEILKNQQVVDGLNVLLIALGVALGIIVGIAALAVIGIGAIASAIAYLIGLIVQGAIAFSDFTYALATASVNLALNIYNSVTRVFSGFFNFFKKLWEDITALFVTVGTTVGNAIGNSVRTVVNSVLKGAIGIINGFVDSLNGVVDVINKIPGVKVGKVGRLNVPQLADGGIVQPRPGGTLANIAEAGQAEAVIPLDKLDDIIQGNGTGSGSKIEINVSGVIASSPQDQRRFAEVIGKRLNEIMQQKGYQPAIEGL